MAKLVHRDACPRPTTQGLSGIVANARGLVNPPREWRVGAVPVSSLLALGDRGALGDDDGTRNTLQQWTVRRAPPPRVPSHSVFKVPR